MLGRGAVVGVGDGGAAIGIPFDDMLCAAVSSAAEVRN